jgi:hypothetical protein
MNTITPSRRSVNGTHAASPFIPPADSIPALFEALAAPFEPGEVQERDGSFGKKLRYITAHTARRLNDVLGPAGWECDITPTPDSVVCHLTVHLPDGRSLIRAAIGGYPDMTSHEDRVKGGDSDAFKRAAVLFGVGAYLYDDDPAPARTPAPRPTPNGPRLADVRTGRELFGWAKEKGLLPALTAAGRKLGLPARVVDWNAQEVEQALAAIA